MRSPEDIYDELEADHHSRESEIRLVTRLLATNSSEDESTMLRRSLILLTYAHVEGYAKFAMLAYVSALNGMGIRCAEATFPVAAASLARVFAALRNPNSKHEVFKNRLPDDAHLHLAAREQVFIEKYETIVGRRVKIPDEVVDTASNLSADILKKMLFRLGLPYPVVDSHSSNINRLLGIRNAIAHGDRLKVPTDKELMDFTSSAFAIMKFLQDEIYSALKGQIYLKVVPTVRDEAAEHMGHA
jgi:hypothetical protein